MREATIICRPTSRHGLESYRRLCAELPKRGVTIVETHMVKRRKQLQRRVRAAIKSGKRLIVVIGGDGSQAAAVAELAHRDAVLAAVPAGTGNSFAFSLGIKDVDGAIEAIVSGREIRVDLGIVNGTYFANFATIGVLANAANRTSKPLKRLIGPIAYGIASLRPLLRRKSFKLRVTWPGNRIKIVTHEAVITSGRYFGRQPVTPQANIRSGKLAFFASADTSTVQTLTTTAALLLGAQTKLPDAHYFSASKINIKTKPKQPVNIDGHEFGKTPVKFRISRAALRVLVPADFKEHA